MAAVESEIVDFEMILIGGRIFVIFGATRHVFDKIRPACQWDDDSGWLKLLEFLMVTFSYNYAKR